MAIRKWLHWPDIGTMAQTEAQIHHRRYVYEITGGQALRRPLAIGQEVFVPPID